MNRAGKNTAFYIEIIALLLLLVFGITVLVQVFGKAQEMGRGAKELSAAVPLAQSAAEIFVASDTSAEMVKLLGGNAYAEGEENVTAFFSMEGAPTGSQEAYFTLEVSMESAQDMRTAVVSILRGAREVYALKTQVYYGQA